jgi:hypothetical protein
MGMHLFVMSWWGALILSSSILLLFLLPSIIAKERRGIATNMNLLTTMLLGGFWHGASWNFVIWGALHGISLVIHKIWAMLTGKALARMNNRGWYNALAILITFHFVCFCWIFFKAADYATAVTMIHQITHDFSFSVWNAFAANYWPVLVMMAMAYLLHAIPDQYADGLIGRFRRIPLVAYITIFFGFVILYGYFKSAEPVMPIYLQF